MEDSAGSVLTIREKQQGDIEILRALFLDARRNTFSRLDSGSYKLDDFDEQTRGEYVLVAVADDHIAGFISLWLADNFIHHLYVDCAYYRQSIGTELINAAKKKAGLPLTLKCLESNINAIGFYKKRGFAVKATGSSDEGTYIVLELNPE